MTHEPQNQTATTAALERVLGSSGFQRNERMSRFLRLLVERHLEERDAELKESLIAIEVFGRKPDYDPKQDSIVRTEAARLRSRLAEYYGREGQSDPVVISIPKGGYVPVFTYRDRASQSGSSTAAPSAVASTPRVRRWLGVAALSIAVAIGAGMWWWVGQRREPIRIAVLPLQDVSPEPGFEFFADGLTDEIISSLSLIDGLAVRSRTSSFAFKGRSITVGEMGRDLNVDYLVEGSVFRSADRVRVEARVVRVRDDQSVWSGRFDHRLADVLAIQDDVALGIVNNFRLQVGRGRRRYETSIDAYDHYLRGRTMTFSPDEAPAIAEFKLSIEKDPQFAPAYAALAHMVAFNSVSFPDQHPPDELETIQRNAEKALALDPLLAEAHSAIALSWARLGRWSDADAQFRQAVALAPQTPSIRADYVFWVLVVAGRNSEAVEHVRVAAAADPLSWEMQIRLGTTLLLSGGYEEAKRVCLKVPKTELLATQCVGRAELALGNFGAAIEVLSRAPDVETNPQARGMLGHAYARAGNREEAERMAAASRFPNEQALIYAGLGDKERALQALERMNVLGGVRVGRYLYYPEFALLRDDVRVTELRRKLGLPLGR